MAKKHWEYDSVKKSNAKYAKKNTANIGLKLNKNTDMDILEWLSGIENRQGYIKSLIRADILKKQGKD